MASNSAKPGKLLGTPAFAIQGRGSGAWGLVTSGRKERGNYCQPLLRNNLMFMEERKEKVS
jgi:hypothetical protein